uniref:G-protein coupled receptors family 1 profile domain-containing protein n=1 Tax=Rhinopithecus roxellana TaxID=61622 RepID=A0A2K6PYG3_RHIRO
DIFNGSITFIPITFTLVGILGLEAEHIWISIPFCLIYTIIFLGNGIILHIIRIDSFLHQPMYYFLAVLAFAELGVFASTMPTVLNIFLFGINDISFDVFYAFFHSHRVRCPSGNVSGSLCGHLQPTALHNHPDNCPHYWDGCRHCLEKCNAYVPNALSPEASAFLCILGLFVITFTFGLDSLFVVVSYVLILHTVLEIASGHICAVLVYYVPMISLSLMHCFGWHSPPLLQTVMANAYLFFPPVVNSVVYSIKTKEIHNSIVCTLSRK